MNMDTILQDVRLECDECLWQGTGDQANLIQREKQTDLGILVTPVYTCPNCGADCTKWDD